MIRERLAGTKILVTGVTGFVGQAVLERLLSEFPDTRIVLLVRPRGTSTGRQRVEELLTRPAFSKFRAEAGEDATEHALARIEVLEGDVSVEIPALPGDLDLVFHCAAEVSFDPPIDEGFKTNLLGAVRLYEAIATSGGHPHVVHLSTAYVAGITRGVVPEEPLSHTVDWRAEAEAALAARPAAEDASRKPEQLYRFVREARREHGRAGPQTSAEDAERRRKDWVRKRLVQYGRARANTLGWPDAYSLTKALGERAAEEHAAEAGLPLSIVRPSIIESALAHPFPGWIEGFKMAEPIILAYGRGAIPEFPAIPEGVLDVIPVDLVVNAMLAIAATPPEPGAPQYFHISSGARNPLNFHFLVECVRDYYREHPLVQYGRGEIKVPIWKFPGGAKVEGMLRRGEKAVELADRILSRLPRSKRLRDLVRRLDREKGRVEFLRRYADLYGPYTEAEVIYTDDKAMALLASLPEEDREAFPFDAAVVDWRRYLIEFHCPAITAALRASATAPRRPEPAVVITEKHDGILAVFDLEGTIIASNVIEGFLWLKLADLEWLDWPGAVAALARDVPGLVRTERRDRGDFLRRFYRKYEGASVEELRRVVAERVSELILRRTAPAAVRRIREHRAAGHRTVLITGALEFFVEPLRPLFDEVVGATLEVRNGRYTGYLLTPPIVGEARVGWLKEYAAASGHDLAASYAYADSHSDLPLLRAVGHPVAVNPDVSLYREARRKRWPIEEWKEPKGTPRVLVPESVP